MFAEFIKFTTADNKILFGALYEPKKATKDLAVLWVHGMTGSMIGEIESVVPELLANAGYPCFCFSNRGYGYKGAATETLDGCVHDINAGLDVLQSRGYKNIALMGHSKGGVKVAYFLSKTNDSRIKALGILSPADCVHNVPEWMAKDMGRGLVDLMKEASAQVADGKGETMFIMPNWPYFVSAQTLVEHNSHDDDVVLDLVPHFNLPMLALCGELETDWCFVATTLAKDVPANAKVVIVPGADHVFAGVEPALAKELVEWLDSL